MRKKRRLAGGGGRAAETEFMVAAEVEARSIPVGIPLTYFDRTVKVLVEVLVEGSTL
jgi:hypothetical protein